MFLYYYIHVAEPVATVSERVTSMTGRFNGMAGNAMRAAKDAADPITGRGLARLVTMECGRPVSGPAGVTFPVRWKAPGETGLLPEMDAELSLASVGPRRTQLTFRGSYQPPLGVVGVIADRAVMHRLAEYVVKTFMDQLAQSLNRDLQRDVHEQIGAGPKL